MELTAALILRSCIALNTAGEVSGTSSPESTGKHDPHLSPVAVPSVIVPDASK